MKSRPIIFSAESVRAILEGRKTQTRRVINPQPLEWVRDGKGLKCPFGKRGDQPWVRETYYWCKNGVQYKSDGEYEYNYGLPWKSPMFMPKSASRITLEIVNVKVQKLKDISESDAEKEGVEMAQGDVIPFYSYKEGYQIIWNKINAKRGFPWDYDPWVWAIEFRKQD